jgi:hypothetical protein
MSSFTFSTPLWQKYEQKTDLEHYALKIFYNGEKKPYHNFFCIKMRFFYKYCILIKILINFTLFGALFSLI